MVRAPSEGFDAHSGLVRLLDLTLGAGHRPGSAVSRHFLVAPDDREDQVRAQRLRPALHHVAELSVRYLPCSELERNRDKQARFGVGMKAVDAAARRLA